MSKLNRRQLKKISKVACDALIDLGHIEFYNTWIDEDECQWVLSRSNVVDYDFDLCTHDLERVFKIATDTRYDKKKLKAISAYKSLSEGSRIHFMFKYLKENK